MHAPGARVERAVVVVDHDREVAVRQPHRVVAPHQVDLRAGALHPRGAIAKRRRRLDRREAEQLVERDAGRDRGRLDLDRIRARDGSPAARLREVRAEACRALDPRALRFLDAVSYAMPEDAHLVCDMCIPGYWLGGFHRTPAPRGLSYPLGWGTLGCAFPQGLGAALGARGPAVSISGDGGFLMNSQELETAKRIGANITVVIWRDDGYGLIDWKQRNEFGRPFAVEFGNPDFVAYAESFGLAGFRPATADDLYPTLMRALEVDGPSVVEVPIDYRENLRLTQRLGSLMRGDG